MLPLRRAPRGMWLVSIALLCAAGSAGCGRDRDDAVPVATPSVVLLPREPSAGEPVDIEFTFAVAMMAPALREDYRVFVHFLDGSGRLLWTYDHEPSIPTHEWKPNQRVRYTRTTIVPEGAAATPVTMQVGLFSPASGERVPLAGASQGDRAYAVAAFTPQRVGHAVFVTFTEGWHGTENPGDGSVEEWRWSSKSASVSFRNPRRDITLFLEVDQPSPAAGEQRVDVQMGGRTIDRFMLTPGARELRRIDVAADVLGDDRTSQVVLTVDKTFVPAAIPSLSSSDPRELGIRLFQVFVRPR